jgi:iron complex outermembrane recepter protein
MAKPAQARYRMRNERSYRLKSALFGALLIASTATPALAQRTDDNAVTSADDAFGKSVGDSRIGIYNSDDVRGFSPADAGNLRIEGLYFDQQGFLTDRIQDGSTIRVGISAQSYPFPAPTGIADYSLRRAGAQRLASIGVNYGPFGSKSAEVDLQVPIDGERLGIVAGAGIYREREPNGSTPNFFPVAIGARWAPRAGIEIMPFWARVRVSSEEAQSLIFSAGDYLPKRVERGRFYGQPWAQNASIEMNYGVVARADPLGFDVRLGVFRSSSDSDTSSADLLFGTTPDGRVARRVVVREDGSASASTSGELRISRSLTEGKRRHTLIGSIRGRAQDRRYGGAAIVDLGASVAGAQDFRPEPVTAQGPKTRDRVTQTTFGLAYQGKWASIGEIGLSVQKTQYRKRTTDPDPRLVIPETRDSPFLYSATAAIFVTPTLAAYGGYTRGLEESPVAPEEAVNLNEAPPAIRTEQKDAGVRWTVSKGVTAVLGVFDVAKPYFNLDAASRFRQLGMVRHRGVEVSIAGPIAPGFNLVAGAVYLDATVSGEEVQRGLIGRRPIGATALRGTFALDYRFPRFDALSLDFSIDATSDRTANAANTLVIPTRAFVSMGGRYRFKVGDTPVLVRAQIGNVTNVFGWNVGGSGFFVPNGPRRFSVSIAADV